MHGFGTLPHRCVDERSRTDAISAYPRGMRHFQIVLSWKSSTWYIQGVSDINSQSPPSLKEMRVVNIAGENPQGLPVECRVALGAPHLIAPHYLGNHNSTIGAGLAVLGDKLCGLYVCGVARVVAVPSGSLDFITVRARPVLTDFTFPLGA